MLSTGKIGLCEDNLWKSSKVPEMESKVIMANITLNADMLFCFMPDVGNVKKSAEWRVVPPSVNHGYSSSSNRVLSSLGLGFFPIMYLVFIGVV